MEQGAAQTEAVASPPPESCLAATSKVDSNSEVVEAWTRRVIGDIEDPIERARQLFLAVRDGIPYDPYQATLVADEYRASATIERGTGFCVQKAIVLAAVARAAGIPARVGFADVRNHLASQGLLKLMRTDVFAFHGYTELFLDGAWAKATPIFHRALCRRFRVAPLEFDGKHDAIFHAYNGRGERYMEYLRDHGTWSDLPMDALLASWREWYPHFFGEHATQLSR